MKVVTNKEIPTVVAVGTFKEYWDNGYPIITDLNGMDCAYPNDVHDFFDVGSIPEDYVSGKYCYTEEKGFYPNPDYVEPDPTNTFGIPDDVYRAIKNQAIAEVQKGVSDGTL